MSETLAFHTVDVFTHKRFAGNPLAIVEGADRLTVAQMQTIAREFNLSETIFIQRADDSSHTAKVRIFFPTAEIPFAGHPTVGCAIHLAELAHPGNGDFETEITLEEVAGLVPVKVWRKDGACRAQFTAPVVPFAGAGRVPDVAMAASALGLASGEIGFGAHRVRQWQGGPTFLFVPVQSRRALTEARPCEPGWSAMTSFAGVDNTYIYTRGGDSPETAFRVRMFFNALGTVEDPATGSASALLAAQLLAAGEMKEGTNTFRLEQGYEMSRPSDIEMQADIASNKLTAVRIAGSSVKVSSGQLLVA